MVLTTERLLLREFRAVDWEAVHQYHNNPLYYRYYAHEGETAVQSRDFVQMFLDQQQARPRTKYQLAITVKGRDELIGNCGIRMETAVSFEGNIGYELNPKYWGYGYATEAAYAIVAFGFAALNLHRISAQCLAVNTASINVLQKLGMKQEGRLRQNQQFKDSWWDTLLFGLLKDEWQNE
ncbi:MAG: GNAT family protein [Chloroflexota bacterium]